MRGGWLRAILGRMYVHNVVGNGGMGELLNDIDAFDAGRSKIETHGPVT
jgi:hypothetical protein